MRALADWTPEAAWAEMLRSGFHVRPTLRGFETYFWRHTRKPDWVVRRPEQKRVHTQKGPHPFKYAAFAYSDYGP